MTDTLGEDRLLDQVDTWLSSHTDAEPTLQLHKCAEWLARLCARVRHLEAQLKVPQNFAAISGSPEARANNADYDRMIAERERDEARAASQRLTEALRMIAEYNVGANHGAVDEWTEAAAFHDCKKLAQATLRAGAPPEDAR